MSPRKKILVVDDDPGILELMSMVLDEAGYETSTARNGDTIYRLKNNHPDMFLLDIWMSGRDGCRICKYIKSRKKLRHVPVILVSANNNGAQMARDAGADDFIAKPFDIDVLLTKVERHMPN